MEKKLQNLIIIINLYKKSTISQIFSTLGPIMFRVLTMFLGKISIKAIGALTVVWSVQCCRMADGVPIWH